MSTINTAIKRETHPSLTLENIMDAMHDAVLFSKIEMNATFYEAELESDILIYKTYITIYQTYINFSYIYSKVIL